MPQLVLDTDCWACRLRREATQVVWGELGSGNALFIAESPGKNEDKDGLPMVRYAKAGKEYTHLLNINGLSRKMVSTTNLCKCHPPNNRDPKDDEIRTCVNMWLHRELLEINPKYIVTVGRYSTRYFLGDVDMEMVHGIPFRKKGFGLFTDLDDPVIIPCYHPASGLRNPVNMMKCHADFRTACKIIKSGQLPSRPDPMPGNYAELKGVSVDGLITGKYIAIDTEEDEDGGVWCISLTDREGSAYVVMNTPENQRTLESVALWVEDPDVVTILHNSLYDLPQLEKVNIRPKNVEDTMVMAYLLQSEPQGLKQLSYRHLGMDMQAYENVLGDIGRRKALKYLAQAVEYDWPDAEPVLVREKDGEARLKQPQNIGKKMARILEDTTIKEAADPYKRWNQIPLEEGREVVEMLMGEMPRAYLKDVDRRKAVEYACLSGDSKIQLSDGSTESIKKIVRHKLPLLVKSLNQIESEFENKRIVGWHRNKHDQPIQWLKVLTDITLSGRWGPLGAKYTPDHLILLRNGKYKPVERLEKGDWITTPFSRLNSVQRQIILGSLLGDGSVAKRNSGGLACFNVTHCQKQWPYLRWIKETLGDVVLSEYEIPETVKYIDGRRAVSSRLRRLNTIHHPELFRLREAAYTADGRKVVNTWVDDIDALGLAVWYQDDGTLIQKQSVRICTMSFGEKSIKFLRDTIFVKFGLKATFYKESRNKKFVLTFHKGESYKFFKLISEFIHPSMRYKLPIEFRKVPFNQYPIAESLGPVHAEVKLVYPWTASPAKRGNTYISYCIDVEDNHNFCTQGEIVHNCADADATFRLYPILKKMLGDVG